MSAHGVGTARALVVLALACLLSTVASVLYTRHTQQVADHRWCELMRLVAVPESSVPKTLPKDDYDRQIRGVRAVNKLARDLGC